MAEYFAEGHLRFVNSEWRDDNGKAIEISHVRHGRWIDVREKRPFGDHYFLCSNCKSRNGLMIPFNYCPNCGAKIDLPNLKVPT